MTLAAITLGAALAALLLYLAPLPTLAGAVALAALMHPAATTAAAHLLAVLVIAAAATVTWRELRGSGWRLLVIRS